MSNTAHGTSPVVARRSADSSARRRAFRRGCRSGLTAALLSVATPAVAHADILHLTSGGTVEGDVTASTADAFHVRTRVGAVVVRRADVARIENTPSLFAEYDRRASSAAQTAPAQVELAEWCTGQGLSAEARRHLTRALELDPDSAPARRGLGFVRVGALWVDGRTALEPTTKSPPDAATADATMRKLRGQWSQRIRAVQSTLLESGSPQLSGEGREQILAIRDVEAVVPLAEVLSRGGRASREVLVEALAHFDAPEATLNLAVLALVDAETAIRARAIAQLVQRADPSVPAQLRKALASDSDVLVRRAAEALGALRVKAAVPELIDALTVQRRKRVEVPVQRYFRELPDAFSGSSGIGAARIGYRPQIGVAAAGDFVHVETEQRIRDVTVFRTEVLEALKMITGENFGFEEAAWRRWYQEQSS